MPPTNSDWSWYSQVSATSYIDCRDVPLERLYTPIPRLLYTKFYEDPYPRYAVL